MPSGDIKDVPESTHAGLHQLAAAAHQWLKEYLRSRPIAAACRPTVKEVLGRAGGPADRSRSRTRSRLCAGIVLAVDASIWRSRWPTTALTE